MSVVSSPRVTEQLRRVAARSTKAVVLRWGRELDMWVGCGYPRSGTVWLCQLMSSYLAKPYPRDYLSPVVMSAVVHAHWLYESRMPPTVYVVRDGRDVMTSFYFYQMRMLAESRNPRRKVLLDSRFRQILGEKYDPGDVVGNLAPFMDHELTSPDRFQGATWADHVRAWTNRPGVAVVRYEDLLADTAGEIHRCMVELGAPRAAYDRAELAAHLHRFERGSGRAAGEEDRFSFMRKGVAGDWRQHFSQEAARVFDRHAGDVLVELGYEPSRAWVGDR